MKVDFPTFFAIWANMNGWTVPAFHWDILAFLSDYENWENQTGVLQVWRGAAKSTLLDLWIVWMLVEDPTINFLILSADQTTSRRITRDCRYIIERHPMAMDLKSDEEQWQAERFSVRGCIDARNPSVSAHGIMSNITSARATYVIFDDVEVPKNSSTEFKREQLRLRISETTHILKPLTGRSLYVGTPHAFNSVYPERIAKGCSSVFIPLLSKVKGKFPNMTGTSKWPDYFTDDEVSKRQNDCKTKSEFLSQYQLMPFSIEESILDPSLLDVYDEEPTFMFANGTPFAYLDTFDDGTPRTILAGVSAFWDVALSKSRGDDSVLAIVFSDTDGHYYLHRTLKLVGDVYKQCVQVREACEEFNIPMVRVETNGVGAFVPQILLKEVRGMHIGVDGIYSKGQKGIRIIESFETPMSGGFIHIHRSVAETPFIMQMRDFKPKSSIEHDDYIDASASAIANEPIRISRGGTANHNSINMSWGESNGNNSLQVDMVQNS